MNVFKIKLLILAPVYCIPVNPEFVVTTPHQVKTIVINRVDIWAILMSDCPPQDCPQEGNARVGNRCIHQYSLYLITMIQMAIASAIAIVIIRVERCS